jgi:hypothetical protein
MLIENLISEKDLTTGTKIMNRRIDSRSTTGSSHAPFYDNASKQKLLASMLNLPWLRAAASKFKSGVVLSEIWLRVKYQKGKGHPHIFNGYLLAFIQSTVQILWLFARWRLLKLHFWADCRLQRKLKSGDVSMGFFPWVEYQKVGKLFQLSIGYLYSLNRLTV